jgi:putative redox protein
VHGGQAALDNVDVPAASPYQQRVVVGSHILRGDAHEGKDVGPRPYEFLLASLGMCTSLTMQMYADRKKMPLVGVSIRLTHNKVKKSNISNLPSHMAASKNSEIDAIHREISIAGPQLTDADRHKLIEIAEMCPVHRTLEIACLITTVMTDDIIG